MRREQVRPDRHGAEAPRDDQDAAYVSAYAEQLAADAGNCINVAIVDRKQRLFDRTNLPPY
jgi:hypothetical protein